MTNIVHMFWHGRPLSRVEWLSLASFVHHGHQVYLHVYEDIGPVPLGVRLINASETLDRNYLFNHRRTGSVALFADWFRYRLLYEWGGIWVDTDVVCLKPFEFESEMVLGWESSHFLCNAVIGCDRGNEFMKWMAECCEDPNKILPYDDFSTRIRKWGRRYLQGNRRENIRWAEYGPKGLTHAARHFDVLKAALPIATFYPIRCEDWQSIFDGDADRHAERVQSSHGLHLWNTMLCSKHGFDKNDRFPQSSLFERLWRAYVADASNPH